MARVSGPRLKLYIDGDGAAEDELKAIGARARDAKPVLRVIQGLMARGAKEQFETEGERGGLAWDKDTQAWVKRKAAKGQDTRTERRTGALWESLTMEAGDFAEEIRKVLKTSTTFGTRLFYAQFQGYSRQLLRITLKDADRWAELMVDWILSGNLPGGGK
jgi:phage gpG-like protein